MTTDEDIAAQLQAEQVEQAFETLLDRYQHKVFRLASSILGDPGEAEDAAQEVFLQIWKALPYFRGESSLSTWIYAIARNRCLTRRKRTRDAAAAILEPRPVYRPARSGAVDLAALLGKLPAPYRHALQLFYMEEKSYEEVSVMLGLPLGTVKTYLHRARKQLAESLKREVAR